MIGLGPRFHQAFGSGDVPDDLSELLDDDAGVTPDAPCDTCDGVGAGLVDGDLMTCPACHGTGVIATDQL